MRTYRSGWYIRSSRSGCESPCTPKVKVLPGVRCVWNEYSGSGGVHAAPGLARTQAIVIAGISLQAIQQDLERPPRLRFGDRGFRGIGSRLETILEESFQTLGSQHTDRDGPVGGAPEDLRQRFGFIRLRRREKGRPEAQTATADTACDCSRFGCHCACRRSSWHNECKGIVCRAGMLKNTENDPAADKRRSKQRIYPGSSALVGGRFELSAALLELVIEAELHFYRPADSSNR